MVRIGGEANRAQLGEIAHLVTQALRQLEVDLGDDTHGLHLWRAKCLDNLVNAWIPKLVHTYENERELGVLASAELQRERDATAARARQPAVDAGVGEALPAGWFRLLSQL